MDKAGIIEKTLREIGQFAPANEPCGDEQNEEAFIISVLQDSLPDGVDIRTCEDFRHLNIRCCETCHNFYPHYEMSLIDLPYGGKAWVCDAVKQAIYPERYRTPQEAMSLLKLVFGEDVGE
jgi:hypothetical protein